MIRTPDGLRAIPPGSVVRLLHPVLARPGELGRLREVAARLCLAQPIGQLWRETCQLSAAERDAVLHSDRYAGHVLRFGPSYGLARRRGWAGGFLPNVYDGGQESVARKDYPAAGLRASWGMARLDQPGWNAEATVDLCVSGRLTFSLLGDVVRAPVPLADVPAEVFSEAMRDLGLVISSATVASDPAWLERHRGQPGLDAYWDRIAVGGWTGCGRTGATCSR